MTMAKYHILGKFTDQGIKNVKETVKRSERFEEMAKNTMFSVSPKRKMTKQ